MKFKRQIFIESGKLDLVPLINVVFLLLIFFMLTSSFILQPGIRVNRPRAVTSEVLGRGVLTITVMNDGVLYIDERPVTEDELVSRVTMAARDSQPILIRADKEIKLGRVIKIWDICRQADVKQISIATTQ